MFTDEFELGPAGYAPQYGSGATQDCTVKWSGTCSLSVTSTDASGVCITKNADVSMSGVTTVSWYLRPSSTSTVDDSTSLEWGYNDGGGVTGIHYDDVGTDGGDFYVADTYPGFALGNPDVWYKVAVEIRPGLDKFHARLYSAAGTLLATSGESSGMAPTSTSITSFRICGRGVRDNYDTLQVDVDGTAPSAPQDVLAAITENPADMRVTWSAPLTSGHPSFGIDHYKVWRASDIDGPYEQIDVVYADEPREYFDYGLPTDTTYYYKVSAAAAGGESALAPPHSIAIEDETATPLDDEVDPTPTSPTPAAPTTAAGSQEAEALAQSSIHVAPERSLESAEDPSSPRDGGPPAPAPVPNIGILGSIMVAIGLAFARRSANKEHS